MTNITGKNSTKFRSLSIAVSSLTDLRRNTTVTVLLGLGLVAILIPRFLERPARAQEIEQVAISGMVRDNNGRPFPDIMISIDGSRRASSVTGPDGTYSILVPKGGSYVVTPFSSGVLFAPGSLSFEGANTNVMGVNFIATRVKTFKVAGTVVDDRGAMLSDVVIRVSDSPQVLTITGPGGAFSFDHLTGGGGYTLVPSKSGFTFNPPAFVIPSLTRDFAGINFVGVSGNKVVISGMVTDNGGQPLADVIVGLSGPQPSLVPTTGTGVFNFVVPAGGSYLIAPARDGFTFNPPSLSLTNLTQNASSVNFVGMRAPMVGISGFIVDGNGAPMTNVPVSISGSANNTLPSGPIGNYAFSVLASGNYTIVPMMPGVVFSPPARTFNNLTTEQAAVNFVGTPGVPNPNQERPDATPGPLVNLPEETPSPEASPSPSPSPNSSPEPGFSPTPLPTPKASGKQPADKPAEDSGPKPAPATPNEKSTAAVTANTKTASKRTRGRRGKKRKVTRPRGTKKKPPATRKRPAKRTTAKPKR